MIRSKVWFEKWPMVCFFVLSGWVSRSSVIVFERKKFVIFLYQVCRIVVEGEVEEEAKGGKGRLS
jgi:hypothetical protein